MTDSRVSRLATAGILGLLASLFMLACASGFAQTMTLPEIQTALRADPPATGGAAQREAAIDNLDLHLGSGSSSTNPSVKAFYDAMMGYLASEIDLPTTGGARVWSAYCSGNIVKTPSATIGFDLIDGCSGWNLVPDSVLQRIQVLFITHCRHSEHWSSRIAGRVKSFGGAIVMPSEDLAAYGGDVGLAAGQSAVVGNLQVTASAATHGVPTRIFRVITPEGLVLLYAGALSRSSDLPAGMPVDVLFVSGFVNDGGSVNYTQGMRNCIERVRPDVMIPGHFHDLTASSQWRLPYSWGQAVDDVPVPGLASVQAWGECYVIAPDPDPPAGAGKWTLY